ncbi:MAG: right-handed parallel beta-helix repeat-containing protein [Candidatus Micrarchaeia archaeon]|jgi:hypothetical protein
MSKKRPMTKDEKFIIPVMFLIIVLIFFGFWWAFHSSANAGNPPVSEVKRYWAYAGEYVIDGTGATDMTTQMRTLFSAARNIQLQPGKTYKITDSLVIPESTTVWLNGANILVSLSSAKYGIVVRKSGVKIYGPGGIVTSGSMTRPNGTYGCAVMVGYWPMTNPVVPVDGFEMKDVTLRTAFEDAYALGLFGLVRNPKISQVKLVSASDACAGLIAAEWAYGYDSTKTYHPQDVILEQWKCPDKVDDSDVANVVYFSGVDGFRISDGIIEHTGNNGVSIVAGELGFSLADTLYHRKADTLFSSAGLIENVQIRSAHNDGFNIEGKSGTTTNRYYPRLTFIGCTVDTSNNSGIHAGFRVNNAYGVKFINCRASKHQFGAYVTGTSRNIGFDGCLFFKNRSSGIYIGNDTALYGTTIVNSVFENNGTADYSAGVRIGKAFSTFVGPGNTFGLSADESQTYGVDKDSATGDLYLHGNIVRGYKSGGAGFLIDTNTYAYGNEVAAGLTKYSGAGRGLDMGQYRAPWPKGAANYVFKMDPAGDTAGWFQDATAAAVSGDDIYYIDSAGAQQNLGSPGTIVGSDHVSITSEATDTMRIRAYGFLPTTPAAGDSVKAAINMSGHAIHNIDTIYGLGGSLWIDGNLTFKGTSKHITSCDFIGVDTILLKSEYFNDLTGYGLINRAAAISVGVLEVDSSVIAAKSYLATAYSPIVHDHDNLTADTNRFYNADSTHEAQFYYDTIPDTGAVDRGWTLDLGDGMTTIDSLLSWVYQWGRKGSTIRIDSTLADSMVFGKGRFGKRDSTLVMTNTYTVYNNVTGKALKLCASTNVTIAVQDSGSYYKVLFSATGGAGSGLTYTLEKDSGDWSVFEPISPNTGIKLSGSLQIGDSGITYITDPIFGHGPSYYGWPTVKPTSAGMVPTWAATGDSFYFATPAGTGTVTDAILGDSLNSYPDTAAVVDTALGLLTDANIPNSITITSASDVDTLGTKINAALNTRFSKNGKIGAALYRADTTVADSAITFTNAQLAKFADDTAAFKDSIAAWDNGHFATQANIEDSLDNYYDATTVNAAIEDSLDNYYTSGTVNAAIEDSLDNYLLAIYQWGWSDSSTFGPDSVSYAAYSDSAGAIDTTGAGFTTYVSNHAGGGSGASADSLAHILGMSGDTVKAAATHEIIIGPHGLTQVLDSILLPNLKAWMGVVSVAESLLATHGYVLAALTDANIPNTITIDHATLSDSCGGGAARAELADAVANADYGDVTVSAGAWAVEDGSHAHADQYFALADFDNTTIDTTAAGLLEVKTGVYQPADATLTDIADGTITENLVNTANPWDVNEGGTGANTLTDGGILLGSGTGAITALGAATNGQIPIGDGTTDPVLATITGTTAEVTVTNGAGTITLSIPATVVAIPMMTVLGRGVIADSITMVAHQQYAGMTCLFVDSTNQGSDVDSVWLVGHLPCPMTSIDSIAFVYNGDTGGAIDSLFMRCSDISNGLLIADSAKAMDSINVNLAATTKTRYVWNFTDITAAGLLVAGTEYKIKFRNTLAADNDWIRVYSCILYGTRW